MATGRQASTHLMYLGVLDAASRIERFPRGKGNNLNHSITPFTVSVHPIQQEPGVWFANYMIAEYRNGAERIVANVSMRHATHGTEAEAKRAARFAGEYAAARLHLLQFPHRHAQSTQLTA